LQTCHKKWQLLLASKCYTVRLNRKDNQYYAYFSFEEHFREEKVNLSNGAIGIDLNASPANIAWAEVNHEGNYINSGTIGTPELYDCRSNKREFYVWKYAKEVVSLALSLNKGIVIEKLNIKGLNR